MSKRSANKKAQRATLARLMKYLKPHAFLLVAAFLCAIVSAGGQLLTPVIIGKAVNCTIGVNNVDFVELGKYLIALAAIIAAVLLFQWLMNLCAQRAAHLTVASARRDGFKALIGAPLSYIDGHSHGDLSARLSVDADQIADGIVQGATQIFTGTVTVVGTLVFMIRINLWIAIAVAALTPLSLFVSYFVARGTHKHFTEQTAVRGELYQKTAETADNRALVAAYNSHVNFYSSLVNPSTRLINSLVYAVAAIMGAVFAIDGSMNVGDITSLLLFANQFARPLNEITSVITEFQTSLAAARRILDLTDVEPQDDDGKALGPVGNVALDKLCFSYDPEKPLLQDLELSVPQGTMVAIVGRTGCGKTTLINLLMRFYDPDSGRILFDGVSSSDIKRSSVRGGFGMVLQDSWIFKGTVRDNIAYGMPDATDEQVKAAARAADIDGFIERLPNGYDTVIDDGDGISQGQKQLINIARIMLTVPPMMLLDEATSNIDTRTEKRVQAAFDRLLRPENGKKKTAFVVAHRLSTIESADVILVMDKGRIIERGSHAELIKRGGAYAELYNAQFAG